jgi:type II secretory pathway component PulC
MKTKKYIIAPVLFLIILIIWILNIIIFKHIGRIQTSIKTPNRQESYSPESLPSYNYVFRNIDRDPFNAWVPDTSVKEPVMPVLKLRGVVMSKNGALALIELSDGYVYTMRIGETYKGITIKQITPKGVISVFRDRIDTLHTWE